MKKTGIFILAAMLLCTACTGKEPDGQTGAMNQSGNSTEGTLDGDSDTQNDLSGSTLDADSGTGMPDNSVGTKGSDDNPFISDEENPEADMPDERILDAYICMDADVKEMFRAVLLGEAPFLYVADAKPENVSIAPYFVPYVSDGSAEAMNISDVPSIFYGSGEAEIWNFSVVDLDRDGEDEVALYVIGAAGDLGGKLILHRIGDEIYGYRTGWRTMGELKTDGTYDYSDSTGLNEVGIVAVTEFSETGYTVEKLFYETGDHTDGWTAFFVNGESATEEEYRDADARQDEKPDAEWYEFTEENIGIAFENAF